MATLDACSLTSLRTNRPSGHTSGARARLPTLGFRPLGRTHSRQQRCEDVEVEVFSVEDRAPRTHFGDEKPGLLARTQVEHNVARLECTTKVFTVHIMLVFRKGRQVDSIRVGETNAARMLCEQVVDDVLRHLGSFRRLLTELCLHETRQAGALGRRDDPLTFVHVDVILEFFELTGGEAIACDGRCELGTEQFVDCAIELIRLDITDTLEGLVDPLTSLSDELAEALPGHTLRQRFVENEVIQRRNTRHRLSDAPNDAEHLHAVPLLDDLAGHVEPDEPVRERR